MSDLRRYTAALRQRQTRAEERAHWRARVGQSLFGLIIAPFRLISRYLASRNSESRDHLWTWLQIRTGQEVLRGLFVGGLLTVIFVAISMFAELRADLKSLLMSDAIGDRLFLLGLCFVALGCVVIAIDALRYRNWRKRMPFPVSGWAALVDQERFDYDVWWPCSLTVRFKQADPDLNAAVRAALEFFCVAANRTYYVPDDVETRQPWHVTPSARNDELAVRGHANNRVALRLYQLIRGPLRHLHTLSAGLESVELALHGEGKYVSTPSSD